MENISKAAGTFGKAIENPAYKAIDKAVDSFVDKIYKNKEIKDAGEVKNSLVDHAASLVKVVGKISVVHIALATKLIELAFEKIKETKSSNENEKPAQKKEKESEVLKRKSEKVAQNVESEEESEGYEDLFASQSEDETKINEESILASLSPEEKILFFEKIQESARIGDLNLGTLINDALEAKKK